MRRRDVLMSGAASAAIPRRFAIAGTRDNKLLRYVPTADLSVLDPSWTTTQVSITHGYYVFDTLFGIDHTQRTQLACSMVESATVSDDGLVWSIRLRDGLTFHDGEKGVLARGDAASLRRVGRSRRLRPNTRFGRRGIRHPGRPHYFGQIEAAIPADPRYACQAERHAAGGDAGAARQHRPVETQHRNDRLRPLSFHEERVRPGQQRRLRKVRRLRAPSGTSRLGFRRQGRESRALRMEDHSGFVHRRLGIGERRDRLVGTGPARPASHAPLRASIPNSSSRISTRSASSAPCGSITCIRRSTTPPSAAPFAWA